MPETLPEVVIRKCPECDTPIAHPVKADLLICPECGYERPVAG